MPWDGPAYVVPVLVLPDELKAPEVSDVVDGLKVTDAPDVPAVPDVSVPVPAPVVPVRPLLVSAVMLTGDPLCGSCARI